MATSNTIIVEGDGIYTERLSGGAITPGMLVAITSSNTLVAHATADGVAVPLFAVEKAFDGDGVGDAYASGETTRAIYPQRGSVIFAFLETGHNAAIGDVLTSNGAGALQKPAAVDATVVDSAIVAKAEEALNNSSGSNARILVRVI